METSLRKFLILDTRSKLLVLDDKRDPMRFRSLGVALAMAAELRGSEAPEKFAVLDDLGNKWLWSKTGMIRVALSFDTKCMIEDAIDIDWEKLGFAQQTRCRADGIVETSHHVRLADGPPIPVLLHGRPMGDRTTTERWTAKPAWFERGTLESYLGLLPTRTHKLEQRSLNEKARALRAEEKARRTQESYEAGAQMTCQLCGRLIGSKHGLIAHHGYTRPGGGWQTSSCDGTHHSPLEVSNSLLIETIATFERRCEREKLRIKNVQREKELIVIQIKPHWSVNRPHPYEFGFDRSTYNEVRASSQGKLKSSASFEDYKDEFIDRLKSSLQQTKAILRELGERNTGWRPSRQFVDGEFRPVASGQVAA